MRLGLLSIRDSVGRRICTTGVFSVLNGSGLIVLFNAKQWLARCSLFSFGGGGGFFFALVAFDVAVSLSQLVSRIWWCDKLLDNFGGGGFGFVFGCAW